MSYIESTEANESVALYFQLHNLRLCAWLGYLH